MGQPFLNPHLLQRFWLLFKNAFQTAVQDSVKHQDTLYITGIRGYAALMIVAFHIIGTIPTLPDSVRSVLMYGPTGVVIFFVVSAYTICMTLDHKKTTYRDFLKRRFLRIAPAYYFLLFVILVLGLHSYWGEHFKNGFGFFSFLSHVTFLNILSYENQNNAIGTEWSLSIEFLYYLFIPVLFIISRRWWGIFIVAGYGYLLTYTAPVNQIFIENPVQEKIALSWSPGHYSICFVLGIIAYRFQTSAPNIIRALSCSAVTAALMAAILYLINFQEDIWQYHSIGWVSFFTAAILVTGGNGNKLSQFIFANKTILFIGTISYSLYLYHTPIHEHLLPFEIVSYLNKFFDFSFLYYPISLFHIIISFACATLSYYCIERQFLNKKI